MFNIVQASAVRDGTELISALTLTAQHHTPSVQFLQDEMLKKSRL